MRAQRSLECRWRWQQPLWRGTSGPWESSLVPPLGFVWSGRTLSTGWGSRRWRNARSGYGFLLGTMRPCGKDKKRAIFSFIWSKKHKKLITSKSKLILFVKLYFSWSLALKKHNKELLPFHFNSPTNPPQYFQRWVLFIPSTWMNWHPIILIHSFYITGRSKSLVFSSS